LTRDVTGFGVVEVAADEAGVQMLNDIVHPALGHADHLTRVLASRDLLGDSRDH